MEQAYGPWSGAGALGAMLERQRETDELLAAIEEEREELRFHERLALARAERVENERMIAQRGCGSCQGPTGLAAVGQQRRRWFAENVNGCCTVYWFSLFVRSSHTAILWI